MPLSSIARIVSLAMLWGSSFLWIKISLRGLTPGQILCLRLALGAGALVVVLYSHGDRLPSGRRIWFHLFVAALFGNAIPYLLFAIAERQVDSAVAGMLNATTPLFTAFIALAAGQRQQANRTVALGLTIGLAGTVVLIAPWQSRSQFVTVGALLCVIAAFSYGISYIYIGRFLSGSFTSTIALPAGQLVAATVLAIPTLIADGSLQPMWRLDVVASILILGVAGTGLAYVINYRLIRDDGPIAASVVIYLLPVVSVSLGVLVLDERFGVHALVGTAIVVAGVALVRRSPHRVR